MPLFSEDPSCISPSSSRSKNMAWKVRGDTGRLLPVVSFFLGAALTAAFIFLGATLDVSWRFPELAAWGNGARPTAADEVRDLITASSSSSDAWFSPCFVHMHASSIGHEHTRLLPSHLISGCNANNMVVVSIFSCLWLS